MVENVHLLVTTALNEGDQKNIKDVYETIVSVNNHGKKFITVSFLETISKTNLINDVNPKNKFFISEFDNSHKYKGTNWINHVVPFVKKKYNDDDIIVFLSGRYLMCNENIFDIIRTNIIVNGKNLVAKIDSDIYAGNGVHTFFITFTKKGIVDFYNYYIKLNELHPCIEWDLKKYMFQNKNCEILDQNTILGVLTNISTSNLKIVC